MIKSLWKKQHLKILMKIIIIWSVMFSKLIFLNNISTRIKYLVRFQVHYFEEHMKRSFFL